jgi:hypothetical protein
MRKPNWAHKFFTRKKVHTMPSTVIPQAILPFHTQDVTAQTDTKNPLFNQAASRPPAPMADLPLPQAGASCAGLTAALRVSIRQGAAALVSPLDHINCLYVGNTGIVLLGGLMGAASAAAGVAVANVINDVPTGYLMPTTLTGAVNALLTAVTADKLGFCPALFVASIPALLALAVIGVVRSTTVTPGPFSYP